MKLHFRLLVLLGVAAAGAMRCAAQTTEKPDVRAEAVELIERANALSMSPHLPNLERTDIFRVFGTNGGTKEGVLTRVVVQGTGRRDEVTLGDYHNLEVWNQRNVAMVHTDPLAPPEVVDLWTLTPIHLLRFDDSDVIHAVTNKAGNGQAVRCIEFETIHGEKHEQNEFCVDVKTGTLASQKFGDSLVEYSEYFPFADSLMPGKIRYSEAGVRRMEIDQKLTELKDATENVLEEPPGAVLGRICTTFRRAIGESMPQPKAGQGAGKVDVDVRGIVGVDGKVHHAVVQDSGGRPDLEPEALTLIGQWKFTPMSCEGKPTEMEAEFILHFAGR
jgi:hypothetical protein